MFAMADACTSTFPSYGYHPSGFPSGSCVRWYLMSPATFLANKPTWGQGDLHKHMSRRAREIVLTYYGNSNVSTMVTHLAITMGHTSVYVRSVHPQHGERCSVHISRYVCPLVLWRTLSPHAWGWLQPGRLGVASKTLCNCAPQHFCAVSNVAAVWLALPLRRRSALHRIVLRRKTHHRKQSAPRNPPKINTLRPRHRPKAASHCHVGMLSFVLGAACIGPACGCAVRSTPYHRERAAKGDWRACVRGGASHAPQ